MANIKNSAKFALSSLLLIVPFIPPLNVNYDSLVFKNEEKPKVKITKPVTIIKKDYSSLTPANITYKTISSTNPNQARSFSRSSNFDEWNTWTHNGSVDMFWYPHILNSNYNFLIKFDITDYLSGHLFTDNYELGAGDSNSYHTGRTKTTKNISFATLTNQTILLDSGYCQNKPKWAWEDPRLKATLSSNIHIKTISYHFDNDALSLQLTFPLWSEFWCSGYWSWSSCDVYYEIKNLTCYIPILTNIFKPFINYISAFDIKYNYDFLTMSDNNQVTLLKQAYYDLINEFFNSNLASQKNILAPPSWDVDVIKTPDSVQPFKLIFKFLDIDNTNRSIEAVLPKPTIDIIDVQNTLSAVDFITNDLNLLYNPINIKKNWIKNQFISNQTQKNIIVYPNTIEIDDQLKTLTFSFLDVNKDLKQTTFNLKTNLSLVPDIIPKFHELDSVDNPLNLFNHNLKNYQFLNEEQIQNQFNEIIKNKTSWFNKNGFNPNSLTFSLKENSYWYDFLYHTFNDNNPYVLDKPQHITKKMFDVNDIYENVTPATKIDNFNLEPIELPKDYYDSGLTHDALINFVYSNTLYDKEGFNINQIDPSTFKVIENSDSLFVSFKTKFLYKDVPLYNYDPILNQQSTILTTLKNVKVQPNNDEVFKIKVNFSKDQYVQKDYLLSDFNFWNIPPLQNFVNQLTNDQLHNLLIKADNTLINRILTFSKLDNYPNDIQKADLEFEFNNNQLTITPVLKKYRNNYNVWLENLKLKPIVLDLNNENILTKTDFLTTTNEYQKWFNANGYATFLKSQNNPNSSLYTAIKNTFRINSNQKTNIVFEKPNHYNNNEIYILIKPSDYAKTLTAVVLNPNKTKTINNSKMYVQNESFDVNSQVKKTITAAYDIDKTITSQQEQTKPPVNYLTISIIAIITIFISTLAVIYTYKSINKRSKITR